MQKELFDRQAALQMLDNDESLLKMLLSGFLFEAPFDSDLLEKYINEKKFEDAAHYVHRVKGAARQLAATALKNKGQELEDLLRGKTKGSESLYFQLAKEFSMLYETTFTELKAEFEKL